MPSRHDLDRKVWQPHAQKKMLDDNTTKRLFNSDLGNYGGQGSQGPTL